jgi:hypothetical protein
MADDGVEVLSERRKISCEEQTLLVI